MSAALVLLAAAVYIRDVVQGRAQPNLVTWFLWATAPTIAFCAQLAAGGSSSAVLTLAVGLGPAAVCVAGYKHGRLRLTAFDLFCGSMSGAAIVLWALTRNGTVAIILSILADVLAATPTLAKTYRHPRSESPVSFFLFMASAVITLLTIQSWTFQAYAFAVYIFVLYAALFALAQFRLRRWLRRTCKRLTVMEPHIILPTTGREADP